MLYSRGIRGAITIENDTPELIEDATVVLLSSIFESNAIKMEDISHVLFSLTKDLKSAFPAKFARRNFDFQYVPMMCYNELDVEPSLKKCLRVMVVVNTPKGPKEINHCYLRKAKILRGDLSREN